MEHEFPVAGFPVGGIAFGAPPYGRTVRPATCTIRSLLHGYVPEQFGAVGKIDEFGGIIFHRNDVVAYAENVARAVAILLARRGEFNKRSVEERGDAVGVATYGVVEKAFLARNENREKIA